MNKFVLIFILTLSGCASISGGVNGDLSRKSLNKAIIHIEKDKNFGSCSGRARESDGILKCLIDINYYLNLIKDHSVEYLYDCNPNSPSSSAKEKEAYKRLSNLIEKGLKEKPDSELVRPFYYDTYVLISPALVCFNIQPKTSFLNQSNNKGLIDVARDLYFPEILQFIYSIDVVPSPNYGGGLEEEKMAYDLYVRQVMVGDNPYATLEGGMGKAYWDLKKEVQFTIREDDKFHDKTRIGLLWCFAKSYKNNPIDPEIKKFFDKIMTQTKGDISIPIQCM
ncbi:MAG: hypothetical protein J0L55_08305 [Caulobacterales bacterium]|nr:hypothetical protein [Caulobacterales bacterium]MCA0373277.1 hypothetical protein [Pseudomonadota bacterium]